MFNVIDIITFSTISWMLRSVAAYDCYNNSERSLVIVSTLVLRLKADESFPETSQCTLERADFTRNWRRFGLRNLNKPKIFIKKNVTNHSLPVLSGLGEDPN